ncbi:hypothetical protein I316_06309 [Kwoniella heveanensis BCC8398]|uniref:PLD phosphodiesterase domain-containing protein n=1 Tax=Kwoniella heveanensis BCC8398 TaxID=1296120 RepID=A0A1B9GLN3_9TREE|nr:hypothetical protein I316_06309 [Kwoniella heveanensis BCC8398]
MVDQLPPLTEKDSGLERGDRVETPKAQDFAMATSSSVPSGEPVASSSSAPAALDEPSTPQPPVAYSQPSAIPPSTFTNAGAGPSTVTAPLPSSSSSPSKRSKLISAYLTAHPTHSAGKAIQKTFPQPNPLIKLARRFKVKHSVINGLTDEEMRRWEGEGKELRGKAGWKLESEEGDGTVVTELFWKMYISLLPTLERDPLSGLVPPDLLGSTTTMPLSIISLIPDIMQHYRDVIVRAEKEIFLATNYWQPSNSVNTVSQALRDLSARVVKAGRPKVIVKIMYDRGSWEQLWNSHAPVKPNQWAPLDLPTEQDVPGLDMEVINFHRVLLGTFHAKFLIVDRKVALINSNNIQDRPNLELMTHLEGPIVDAFYEVALHSWWNKLDPPLPCMSEPYKPPVNPVTGKPHYLFQDHNPYFDDIEILKAAKAARILLRRQTRDIDEEKAQHDGPGAGERLRDAVRKVVNEQRQSLADWKPGEELEARAHIAMKELREFRERWGLGNTSRAGSRGPSRGPSRRPSQNDGLLRSAHKSEEDRTAVTSTAAESEAPSSPTVNGDVPLKSKSYPLPHEPSIDTNWDYSAFSPNPAGLRPENNPSRGTSIADHETGQSGSAKRHAHFADFDGTGQLFVDTGATAHCRNRNGSPNASYTRLPRFERDTPMVASPMASTIRLPLETESQAQSPVDPKLGHENGGFDVARGPELAAPIGANSESAALPMTAREPAEMDHTYEKAKKHVGLNLENETKRKDSEEQPEGTGSRRMFQLSKKFNAGALSDAWATVEDSDELDSFKPHVVHAPHKPFPIAMCCRKPHGFPGHHDIRNPQNAAWLAGFRYAKKKVFVQTPTLNARPIVRAVKQACRRGVDVVLLLDLGFNDKGESIPFQGGTNEEVVDRLYKILRKDKKEQYLKVYWYTGKDQVRPLNAVKKQRNCHIKFAAYDDEVAIFGNGNQDSQSWFHSQEINVMIDNKQVVSEMMATLLSNQNTLQYGLVDTDGIWRDKEGHTLEHYGATAKGAFRGLSGFIAFAKTI